MAKTADVRILSPTLHKFSQFVADRHPQSHENLEAIILDYERMNNPSPELNSAAKASVELQKLSRG